MPAILVEASECEEDPALIVARKLEELGAAGLAGKAQDLLGDGRLEALVDALVGAAAPLLLPSAEESEARGCFTILCHMASKLGKQESAGAVRKLSDLVAGSTENAAVRTRFLAQLFNTVGDSQVKYDALLSALRYAAKAGTTDQLMPAWEGSLDSFMGSFGDVGAGAKRELYVAFAEQYAEPCAKSYKCLLQAVATLDTEPAAGAGADELVAKAIAEFLKAKDVYSCDLLHGTAVKGMGKASKHYGMVELLQIFVEGQFSDYEAFTGKNKGLLGAYGLDAEDCARKMRIMTLAGIASTADAGEVSYAYVKEALGIEGDTVEKWIVSAIGAGVLEGRMDQMREVLEVSKTTARAFKAADWEEIATRLSTFKQNLNSIAASIDVVA